MEKIAIDIIVKTEYGENKIEVTSIEKAIEELGSIERYLKRQKENEQKIQEDETF